MKNLSIKRIESGLYKYFLIATNRKLDAAYYLNKYRDVALSGISPYKHYSRKGRLEGRNRNLKDELESQTRSMIRNRLPKFVLELLARIVLWNYFFDSGTSKSNQFKQLLVKRNSIYWEILHRTLTTEISISNIKLENAIAVKNLKNAIFLSGEIHTPGNLYRVENFADSLNSEIYNVKICSIYELEIGNRFLEFKQALSNAEFVWVWRAPITPELQEFISLARNLRIPVIFDVDDLMINPEIANTDYIDAIRSSNFSPNAVAQYYTRIRDTAKLCDFYVSPTLKLSSELLSLGKSSAVVSNGYNNKDYGLASDLYYETTFKLPSDKIRIGYASGSLTHQKDFLVVADALTKILKKYSQVIFVTYKSAFDLDEFPELKEHINQIEYRDLVDIKDILNEYTLFDINIAPLEIGNPFTESKSNLKYFEASLVGVPTVMSATENFSFFVENGKNGYLCKNSDEWFDALSELIENYDIRKKVGKEARERVLLEFGPLLRQKSINEIVALAKRSLDPSNSEIKLHDFRNLRPDFGQEISNSIVRNRKINAKAPAVTVVISLFNYEQFIIETLESLLVQDLSEFDLIIVDGNSSDNSVLVVDNWLSKNGKRFNEFRLIIDVENHGLPAARNLGFKLARTPYVFILDADNYLLPNCLSKLLDKVTSTNCSVAYSLIERFGDDSGFISDGPWSRERLSRGNYIDAMALISKEAWGAAGGYYKERRGWEDYDLWCSFEDLNLRGEFVNEVLSKYRVHSKSMVRNVTNEHDTTTYLAKLITERHPWAKPKVSSLKNAMIETSQNSVTMTEKMNRLTDILPILRSPKNNSKLVIENQKLINFENGEEIPILNGCPVFVEDFKSVRKMADTHQSNKLPDNIENEINEQTGLVLHLGAGSGHQFRRNVIEVEYDVFSSTDVSADAHNLPFKDQCFDLVVCMNAFEHFENPFRVSSEINRVLKSGGKVVIHTAFLQPVHEAPRHFFNATKYGIRSWFSEMDEIGIEVTPNFTSNYSLAWISSEIINAANHGKSIEEVEKIGNLTLNELNQMWENQSKRDSRWDVISSIPLEYQENFSAGFEAWFKRK